MKNLKRIVILIPLLVFPFLMATGCSSDDDTPSGGETAIDKDKDTENDEDKKEPKTSIFEAVINFPDEDQELDFKATGDQAQIYIGDVEIEDKTIPNVILLQMEDEDSPQLLTMFATEVTGEGTYIMGEDGFEVAELFSTYQKDKEDSEVKDNLYTFHDHALDMGDEVYQTEVVLTITSLTEDRIKGNLDIVMYSSVLEYEGTGDDKKLVGGFAHKGVLSAEFDCALEKELDF